MASFHTQAPNSNHGRMLWVSGVFDPQPISTARSWYALGRYLWFPNGYKVHPAPASRNPHSPPLMFECNADQPRYHDAFSNQPRTDFVPCSGDVFQAMMAIRATPGLSEATRRDAREAAIAAIHCIIREQVFRNSLAFMENISEQRREQRRQQCELQRLQLIISLAEHPEQDAEQAVRQYIDYRATIFPPHARRRPISAQAPSLIPPTLTQEQQQPQSPQPPQRSPSPQMEESPQHSVASPSLAQIEAQLQILIPQELREMEAREELKEMEAREEQR